MGRKADGEGKMGEKKRRRNWGCRMQDTTGIRIRGARVN